MQEKLAAPTRGYAQRLALHTFISAHAPFQVEACWPSAALPLTVAKSKIQITDGGVLSYGFSTCSTKFYGQGEQLSLPRSAKLGYLYYLMTAESQPLLIRHPCQGCQITLGNYRQQEFKLRILPYFC